MSRKPPQKCIDCVLSVIHKPGHGIDNKPDCYEHRICARKRSYYRNHAANKERQNKQHRYLKYKGDHCAICQSTNELEVHHITPQSKGGLDARFNLLTLCRQCHRTITTYYRVIGWN